MHNQLNLHDLESNLEFMKKSLISSFSNSYFCKDYKNLIENKKLVFVDDEEGIPIQNWGIHSEKYANLKLTQITPAEGEKLVFGIDSSCIKVAEVEDGGLYAVKGSVCISFKGKPAAHLKIGPLMFYLNEEVLQGLKFERNVFKLILFNDDYAKKFLRVNIERYIQFWISKLISGSIILIDGSLKSSIFENHMYDISKIIENSVVNRNSVIGISKSSKIKILKYLSYPLIRSTVPAFVDINLIIRSLISKTYGEHILVKLSSNEYSNILRADIVSYDNDLNSTLGTLLCNELINFGYPSSLSLSHHVSVFSNTELASIKSFIKSNYSIKEITHENARASVLGTAWR
ncbi:DNA double-strand break repair nuclease NurA [Candidatus Nitrosocosmicus hydrocola]|uniref:DNA double-strand break repair nuclease NurA n=1 Tax=Candidatus Nitrosocosmicus hydrocola TaxID=1826872 RepID=UPI0011E5BE52|nr:DNA double-strand break repair nuclease NurA [Candidatus Nitrosocosmicus hydrocola]